MQMTIKLEQLTNAGLSPEIASSLLINIEKNLENINTPEQAWLFLSKNLLTSQLPFTVHSLFFSILFPHWNSLPETAPACMPSIELIQSANISVFMSTLGIQDVKSFHRWTASSILDFWRAIAQ